MLLLVGSLAVLAGCDPHQVPNDSDAVDVGVRVMNDGTGEVTLYPGIGRSDVDIERVAQSLDSAVFAGAAHEMRLGDNGGGYPLIHLETRGVYEPARLAHVRFDTRGLCDELRSAGYTTVFITLTGPLVGLDWSISPDRAAQAETLVDDCDVAPHGLLTMRSDPERFWMSAVIGFASLTVLSVAYSLSRTLVGDRRVLVTVLSLIAGVPAAWVLFTGAVAGDDAYVAGQLDDGGGWVPIGLQLVLSVVCAIALVALPVQYVQRWNRSHPTSTPGAQPWPPPPPAEP